MKYTPFLNAQLIENELRGARLRAAVAAAKEADEKQKKEEKKPKKDEAGH